MSDDPASYTAADIRVLTAAEVNERWDWAKAGALALHYRRDEGWIGRGLAACRSAGVAEAYFIRRYLDGDRSLPEHEGVTEAFKELLRHRHG